jgi:hypothetical protein
MAPLLALSLEYTFRLPPKQRMSSYKRKMLMTLIKLTEKFNFDNLYSKPVCNVVSKAFSISKNTAAVNMLLKLSVT